MTERKRLGETTGMFGANVPTNRLLRHSCSSAGLPVKAKVYWWMGDKNMRCITFEAADGTWDYFWVFPPDTPFEQIEETRLQLIDLLRAAGEWGGE